MGILLSFGSGFNFTRYDSDNDEVAGPVALVLAVARQHFEYASAKFEFESFVKQVKYTHGWYIRDVRKMETSPVPKFWSMLDSFYPLRHPLLFQTF